MHRRAASYGGWRLGLLLLCLTARASAEAQKGVEAGTDETLDQPLPEQGMSEEDIFADSDLPPIEEDPFSPEENGLYDIPFDEDLGGLDGYYDSYYDFSYFEDDYAELSGLFDDYCSDSMTQFPNATRPCDIKVEGGHEATKLKGGLEGLYAFMGCSNGRPWYKRVEKAKKFPRYLLYSEYWSDWDFSNKSTLSEKSTLGYGGEGAAEWRPELVLDGDWYVLASLTDEDSVLDFVLAQSLKVQCNFNCSDGVQNGDETGIDCGGSCAACSDPQMIAKQQEAYQALRRKLVRERSTLTAFQQTMIALLVIFGTFTVCGGPFMYLIRRQNAHMNRQRNIATSAFQFAQPRKVSGKE